MTRPSRTLTETITNRAIKTFFEDLNGSMDAETWQRWTNHWLKVADDFYNDFSEEGLTETAAAIKKIIEDQKRITSRFNH